MKVKFKKKRYELVITKHARGRMKLRNISYDDLVEIIENGIVKKKEKKNKYWIYKNFGKRKDNYLCLSVAIEKANFIVITALVNWRPE